VPHTARLRRVGGSTMLAIPPHMLEELHLGPDAPVGMSIESGKLMVEPRPRRRYSLEELLAQCDPSAPSEEDRAWLESPPVGRELI
jgi:antitoxin ChpS